MPVSIKTAAQMNGGTPPPPPPPVITTASIPTQVLNQSFSFQLQAAGGVAPLTWTTTSTLPPGVALSGSGVLSGTPTGSAATYSLTVTVTDALLRSVSGPLQFIVVATAGALVITTPALATGWATGNFTYYFQLYAQGGAPPYRWSWSGGPPSRDFNVAESTGVVSIWSPSAGTYPLTVTVTDSLGASSSTPFTFQVNTPPAGLQIMNEDPLPDAMVGVPYQVRNSGERQRFILMAGTGNTNAVTYAVTAGPPSGWLIIDPVRRTSTSSTAPFNVLSGVPDQAGTFPVTLSIQQGAGTPVTRDYTLTVLPCAAPAFPPERVTIGTVASNFITLTWWPPRDIGCQYYKIYRDGNPTPIKTFDWNTDPVFPAGDVNARAPQLRYDDAGLDPGTTYSYQITGVNIDPVSAQVYEGPPSPLFSVQTLAGDVSVSGPTLPLPPADPAAWVAPLSLPVGGTYWYPTVTQWSGTPNANTPGTIGASNNPQSQLTQDCGLQYAFTNALPGDVIVLQAGLTYLNWTPPNITAGGGTFRLPATMDGAGDKWVYIISSEAPELKPGGALLPYAEPDIKPRLTPFTLTSMPANGATSATLTTPFTARTGRYPCYFKCTRLYNRGAVTHTGDGTTTSFLIGTNTTVTDPADFYVTVAGVVQPPSAYSITGIAGNIVFNTAPAAGVTVSIRPQRDRGPFYTNENWSVLFTQGSTAISWLVPLPAAAVSTRIGVAIMDWCVNPVDKPYMATIQTNRAGSCINIAAGVRNVRFIGVNFENAPGDYSGNTYQLIVGQNQNFSPRLDHFYLDRCMGGHDSDLVYPSDGTWTGTQTGTWPPGGQFSCAQAWMMSTGDHLLAHQCWTWGFFTNWAIPGDPTTFSMQGGSYSCFRYSHLEATCENWITSGSYVNEWNHPNNIVAYRNVFNKPGLWAYTALGNKSKNFWEHKAAYRVHLYENLCLQNGAGAEATQLGTGLALTARASNNGAAPYTTFGPWTHISDFDCHDNIFYNTGKMFNTIGAWGDEEAGVHSMRWRFVNNLVFMKPWGWHYTFPWGTAVLYQGYLGQANGCIPDVIFEHNTYVIDLPDVTAATVSPLWNNSGQYPVGIFQGGAGNATSGTPRVVGQQDRWSVKYNIWDIRSATTSAGALFGGVVGPPWDTRFWSGGFTNSACVGNVVTVRPNPVDNSIPAGNFVGLAGTDYPATPLSQIGFANYVGPDSEFTSWPPVPVSDWNVTTGRFAVGGADAPLDGKAMGATLT